MIEVTNELLPSTRQRGQDAFGEHISAPCFAGSTYSRHDQVDIRPSELEVLSGTVKDLGRGVTNLELAR